MGEIMFTRNTLAVALSVSVAAFPLEQARAQDGLVGGIIGGIIGGAIANSNRQRTTTTQRQAPRPAVNTAQREQNRSVQTALNHFGWNVGTADGSIGPRSRAAISEYQVFIGYAGTGQLSEFERNVLLTAHQRAIMGGPQVAQTVSTHPQGMRGLVLAVRDEMGGMRSPAQSAGNYGLPALVATAVDEIAASSDPSAMQLVQRAGFIQLSDLNGDGRTDYILDTSVTGSAFWCSAQACTVQVFVSTPDGYVRNDFQAFNVTPAMFTCQRGTCDLSGPNATVTVAAPQMPVAPQATTEVALSVPSAQPAARNPVADVAASAPAIPNFFGGGQAERSLASHCNRVTLLTNANGGFTTQDKMTDPNLVLNEQFCLARTYAMADGDELIAQVQGVTPQQVAEQCVAFAPALQPHVAALSVQPRDEVMRAVGGFILQTGMNPQQLSSTARICLSVGYQLDNLDVAVGAGLLLVALGEKAYGELMGHHLMQGYGAAQRADLSLAWYEHGLDASKTPVFAPMQPERDLLLRAAVFGAPANTNTAPTATLPVFAIPQQQ
jgi:hypothetical protein